MHTIIEILDGYVLAARQERAFRKNGPQGISFVFGHERAGTGGLEVHVHEGLRALAKEAGVEITITPFDPETYPYIASFDYRDVKFFQIGKTEEEAVG